jgi:hypothetical protein
MVLEDPKIIRTGRANAAVTPRLQFPASAPVHSVSCDSAEFHKAPALGSLTVPSQFRVIASRAVHPR